MTVSADLPHTDQLPPVRLGLLRLLRPAAGWLFNRWWRVTIHHRQHVPSSGPVIFACNHIGALDGPVLLGRTRRLTVVLAKHELFVGRLGRLLDLIGQVPVRRREIDTLAIRRSVRILRDGLALAVFPEGVRAGGEMAWSRGGAVYLAMVTGAPIVPVAILGTRPRGGTSSSLPPRRSRIAIVYGAPIAVPRQPWPRRKALVADWNEAVRVRLADHIRSAVELTGVELPGPVALHHATGADRPPAEEMAR